MLLAIPIQTPQLGFALLPGCFEHVTVHPFPGGMGGQTLRFRALSLSSICLWLPPLSAVVWRMRSVAQHFLCDLLLCNQPSCTHWAICEKHQTEMPGWSAGPEFLRGEGAVLTLRFQTPSCTNWSRRKLHPSLWKRTRLKTQFYCLANCWELLMSAVNTHTKIVSFIVLFENKCTSVFRELALSCGRGIPQGTDESYLSYLRIPSEILWFHGPM